MSFCTVTTPDALCGTKTQCLISALLYVSLSSIQFSNWALIQWGVIDGYLVHRLSFVAQCWEMWPFTSQ